MALRASGRACGAAARRGRAPVSLLQWFERRKVLEAGRARRDATILRTAREDGKKVEIWLPQDPGQAGLTIHRLQSVSGVAVQLATGSGQSLSVDAHVVMLCVPSITADAFKIQLPVVADQRLCNHLLFGQVCAPNPGTDGPVRASFQVVTTVVSQVGRTPVVASIGGHPDRWARFGEITLPSGESRMAVEQVGTTITLNEHFPGLLPGDPIMVYAGCDHSIPMCRDKFANPDDTEPPEPGWYSVQGWSETINQVRLTYTDRANGFADGVVIAQNGANATARVGGSGISTSSTLAAAPRSSRGRSHRASSRWSPSRWSRRPSRSTARSI